MKVKGTSGTRRRKAREFIKRHKMEFEGMELEWSVKVEHENGVGYAMDLGKAKRNKSDAINCMDQNPP
jgi:hypothetical protein